MNNVFEYKATNEQIGRAAIDSVIEYANSIGLINPELDVYQSGGGSIRIVAKSELPDLSGGFRFREIMLSARGLDIVEPAVIEASVYAMEIICADLSTRH